MLRTKMNMLIANKLSGHEIRYLVGIASTRYKTCHTRKPMVVNFSVMFWIRVSVLHRTGEYFNG